VHAAPYDLLKKYHIVLIGGFLHTCLSDPKLALFYDAGEHLRTHGVTLDRVPLTGVESVEKDALSIVKYLKDSASADSGDKRDVVFLGYSKGAPDAQAAIVALAHQPAPIKIKGLITLSGMVGGTRLYDQVDDPAGLSYFLSHVPILACPPGERNLHSLSRQERYRFLQDHLDTLNSVPTYALGTVSSPPNTSLVFRPFWDVLSVYGTDQDGQMALVEQIPPGAFYLGTANADHWAAAMPFETNSQVAKIVNHNHYPRAAFLEAILRFVVYDLEARKKAGQSKSGL